MDTDAHERFQAAMSRYYKTERDRAETCLSDIIGIATDDRPEHEQMAAVLERLIVHYSRSENFKGTIAA